MEWMLQVADEFDDAVGAFRHGCLGVTAEVGMLLGGTRAFLSSFGAALKDSVARRRARP
jgi:hypothetical protein